MEYRYISKFQFLSSTLTRPRTNCLQKSLGSKYYFSRRCTTITYISDVIHAEDLRQDQFNLIAAGCGSGKTYWVLNNLLPHCANVQPYEILFVTSRSIIKEQQARNAGTTKYKRGDNVLQYWNGLMDDENVLAEHGIVLMTYDQLISAVQTSGKEVLGGVKILILDECHAIFSDTFIQDMGLLRFWLRQVIYGGHKTVIGLSATTGIIDYYEAKWSVPINRMNTKIITGYRAEQMICTDFRTIPYLIAANKLQGKTLIMCPSIKHCEELASNIKNSAVIVSPHSDKFTPEMGRIRQYIVQHEALPSTYYDQDGYEHELDVLISTSTLREGINLRESSGVRNVVCCMTDELHVTQFAGRCRYNLDKIVVADTFIRSNNLKKDQYICASQQRFKEYMANKECAIWFKAVAHLIKHDAYGTKKFVLGSDDVRFINYINSRWLAPKGISDDEIKQYRIWRDEDKRAIVDMAVQCKLLSAWKSKVTFVKVMTVLNSVFGYEIEHGRMIVGGRKRSYRLIVSFNEEEKSYVPVFKTISE